MKTIFSGLDKDIRDNLKQQLSVLWTYSSNGLEGNTLTLGETDFVIREGLTIAGKPLKFHRDAEDHYKAIDLIYQMLSVDRITEEHIFKLHRAIVPDDVFDIYKPRGAWKNDVNGTYVFGDGGQTIWIAYPDPMEIPGLMKQWLELYNSTAVPQDQEAALKAFVKLHTTFVSIHPFFDGNGRIARLLANIPVLKGGFPPVTIDPALRKEYLELLGNLSKDGKRTVDFEHDYPELQEFMRKNWQQSYDLVARAHDFQKQRGKR